MKSPKNFVHPQTEHLMPDLDSFDEKQTLIELSNNSEIAFEKIYHLYSHKIYFKIRRLVKSQAITEDILQEVFLAIWNNRSKLNMDKSLCSYLFCVAANKCNDYFRRIKRERKLLKELLVPDMSYDSPEKNIVEEESFKIVKKTIELLPVKRKQIFKLSKVERKTYAEISGQLGISLSTISDHIVKANHFIKARLSAELLF
jgi:RNA polymerase sigma-70 factor (ECF subfamily)